jgi:hypothetical protein
MSDNVDSWNTEPENGSELVLEQIIPDIPKELWDDIIWRVLRELISVSDADAEVLTKIKQWNSSNDPQLPERELFSKALWALRKWPDIPWHKKVTS